MGEVVQFSDSQSKVIADLEALLHKVRAGEYRFVAYVALAGENCNPDAARCHWVGRAKRFEALGGIEDLQQSLWNETR